MVNDTLFFHLLSGLLFYEHIMELLSFVFSFTHRIPTINLEPLLVFFHFLPWLTYLDNGENALKQHLVEEDDEERFQADLKKAVRQSLGISYLSFSCLCSFYVCL